MLAKQAFEKFAAKHGVRILHYHCDNGQFADNTWKQSCKASRQQLTFCGVNAHFQNGIAEHAILGSVGERLQAATPCLCLLASSSAFCIVAICPAQCCPSLLLVALKHYSIDKKLF
jgi:hypothetical protein